ncbi:MAG: hypothetical protein Q8S53_01480, partial [Brevundimonas sp.]|uniref:GspE/PulE/PilB domain-containing protein n=1 Tax=Brevundimonas sp. TaxID=1871086 RepID=UPI0027355498
TYATIFDPFKIDRSVLTMLTAQEAARYGAVPLRLNGSNLDVALAEPLPPTIRAELEKRLARPGVRSVRFMFAPLSDIAFAIRFAWDPDPFADVRAKLNQLRQSGAIDASREAMLWRSVRAGYARLGDILVRTGRISHEDLQRALALSRSDGTSLGQTLVRMKAVTADEIDKALKDQRSARWLTEKLAGALSVPTTDPRFEQT